IIPKLKRAATIVEGKLSEVEATKEGDYIVDEKSKAVALTEAGIASCERLLTVDNLYDPNNIDVLHHIQQALRAHALYKRDVEFAKIYKLDVVVIPTNRPLTRVNNPDVVYKTEREKFNAVVEDIIERHGRGQPVLVGTISIEKSERLSTLLKKRGVRHEVLNAKYHEREAEIVAQAGRQSAVTIATNM